MLSHSRITAGGPDTSERRVDSLTMQQIGILEAFLLKANVSRRVAIECLQKAKWVPDNAYADSPVRIWLFSRCFFCRLKLKDEITRAMYIPGGSDTEQKHSFFVHRNVVTKPNSVIHPADDYRVKNARKREICVAIPLISGEQKLFWLILFFF